VYASDVGVSRRKVAVFVRRWRWWEVATGSWEVGGGRLMMEEDEVMTVRERESE
jgi:hypothetical protein